MHLFYYPCVDQDLFTLDRYESAHCIKVLRLNKNDIIHFTDGAGKICKAKIIKPDNKACMAKIMEVSRVPERPFSLEIAISPTKSIERFEWFLEKATEIGIERIIPLMCKNSERRAIKEERLKKVMIAAMKQSLKAWLPEIAPFTRFSDLMEQPSGANRFIATVKATVSDHLANKYIKGSDVLILIGPEGDFQREEMDLARLSGFIPVSLGTNRLRTETAGLVACHTINLANRHFPCKM
jgi:16S rRNA (uracil1498-N3)-methyltransferase